MSAHTITELENLKSVKPSSRRWRKFGYAISNAITNAFLRREPKIIVVEVRPLFGRHNEMLPGNGLGVLVEQNRTLCGFNSLGICSRRRGLRAMNHEGCIYALTFLRLAPR